MKEPPQRQATAIELSAVLFQAVVIPGAGEQEAAASVATALDVPTAHVQLELLHARAFAVEMALRVGLSDTPAAQQLREQYAARLREQSGQEQEAAWELLQERLGMYEAAVETAAASGLATLVGNSFSRLFEPGPAAGPAAREMAGDLAHLGGRLFAALFEEVNGLLAEVELIAVELDD